MFIDLCREGVGVGVNIKRSTVKVMFNNFIAIKGKSLHCGVQYDNLHQEQNLETMQKNQVSI